MTFTPRGHIFLVMKFRSLIMHKQLKKVGFETKLSI